MHPTFTGAVVGSLVLLCARSLGAQAPASIDPACEQLLPAAEVSRATGRTGVQLIPRDPMIGAGGTCNYALEAPSRKQMVLLVTLEKRSTPQATARIFQDYKASPMYQRDQATITGLGDEAFSMGQTIVVARKGMRLVVLSVFSPFDPETGGMGKAYLTRAQLIELARGIFAKEGQ